MNKDTRSETLPPAGGSQVDRLVGRLEPERDVADYEYGDDDWLEDDGAWCDRCQGDGMDPQCDYLLPCPACQGEQRP